jgi:hypothetical protein
MAGECENHFHAIACRPVLSDTQSDIGTYGAAVVSMWGVAGVAISKLYPGNRGQKGRSLPKPD